VKEFHLTLEEIYALTPRQIQEIYLHPRDEDGVLKAPAPPPKMPPDKLAVYHRLAAMFEMTNKNHPKLPELRRRIQEMEDANAGRKPADGHPGRPGTLPGNAAR
jgi:hypothetical protein